MPDPQGSHVPRFLALLDSDPESAFRLFYGLAMDLLDHTPPRKLAALPPEVRDDVTSEIIYYCIADDFRVLRKYTPQHNLSFQGWLYTVARNRCAHILRQERIRTHLSLDNDVVPELDNTDGESGNTRRALLIRVVHHLGKMSIRCRQLLQMAGDEFTPMEMVTLLRLQASANKKVSDQLRECRRQLRKRLEAEGHDLSNLF
jgi:RNA polymerase sigma factor (sigma-70 family)